MDNQKQREMYVKLAPAIVCFTLGYILYAKLVVAMQVNWLQVVLAVVAALITGFGISLRFLYGNEIKILALYVAAPVSIYLLYDAYVNGVEMAYILILACSALGWYIPQLIFRKRLLAKLASGT
ncbi:hypothetical protein [Microbulbifer elongatus]|uniref:hypothetical protein n=1 Tax=Microbulbifer elongatus TaxID=86173 RepID=UPI001CFC72AB|nr:hypothetical protein [Microbulbifer elongatus]